MSLLAIENRDDIVKHRESAAILAADLNAYQLHIKKRKQQQLMEHRVHTLEEKVKQLEDVIKRLMPVV